MTRICLFCGKPPPISCHASQWCDASCRRRFKYAMGGEVARLKSAEFARRYRAMDAHKEGRNKATKTGVCEHCGGDLTGRRLKFCSDRCGYLHHKPRMKAGERRRAAAKRKVVSCETCGSFFTQKYNARFCSLRCKKKGVQSVTKMRRINHERTESGYMREYKREWYRRHRERLCTKARKERIEDPERFKAYERGRGEFPHMESLDLQLLAVKTRITQMEQHNDNGS